MCIRDRLQCVPPYRRGAIMGLDSAVNTVARILAPVLLGTLYKARCLPSSISPDLTLVLLVPALRRRHLLLHGGGGRPRRRHHRRCALAWPRALIDPNPHPTSPEPEPDPPHGHPHQARRLLVLRSMDVVR